MDDGRRQYRLPGRRRLGLARQYAIQSRDKQRSRPTPPSSTSLTWLRAPWGTTRPMPVCWADKSACRLWSVGGS